MWRSTGLCRVVGASCARPQFTADSIKRQCFWQMMYKTNNHILPLRRGGVAPPEKVNNQQLCHILMTSQLYLSGALYQCARPQFTADPIKPQCFWQIMYKTNNLILPPCRGGVSPPEKINNQQLCIATNPPFYPNYNSNFCLP